MNQEKMRDEYPGKRRMRKDANTINNISSIGIDISMDRDKNKHHDIDIIKYITYIGIDILV
jgi:hypothetical protein